MTTTECPSCRGAVTVPGREPVSPTPAEPPRKSRLAGAPQEGQTANETELARAKPSNFCYSPSGRCGVAAIPLAAAGLLVAVILGWFYNGFLSINPFIYVNFVATAIYGACIGAATGVALQGGKCRNPGLAAAIGLVIGLLSFFIKMKLAYPVSYDLEAQVRQGWGVSHLFSGHEMIRFEGGGVYLVWFGEAAIIAGMCLWLTYRAAGDPFCEACKCWAGSEEIGVIHGVDERALQRGIAKEDGEQVVAALHPGDGAKTASIQAYSCAKCGGKHYVSITLKWKDGQVNKDEEVLRNMSLTGRQIAVLRMLASKRA